MWTWVSGSKELNQPAVYEEIGVPHPNNVPGSRYNGCLWEAKNGVLWLFGGYGISPDGNEGTLIHLFTNYSGWLNDLWKFENGMWTFVAGSEGADAQSIFGLPRIPDSESYPGARYYCVCWKDNNGHFWIYGGINGEGSFLAETWRFDGTNWTFWAGSEIPDVHSVHGEPKTFSLDFHHL